MYSCPLWSYKTIHHFFSHGRTKWSSPSFCSTIFRNLPGISDPYSEVSKFQHYTKQCSTCSTLQVPGSFLKFRSNMLVKRVFLLPVELSFCHCNPGFNFMCISCVLKEALDLSSDRLLNEWILRNYYHASHGTEIFPFSSCYWSIIFCTGDHCFEIIIFIWA